MKIVYAMDVIDPVAKGNARYVRRFTYESREEAWSKYSEAIRFGFEAYVEEVGRMRSSKQAAAASSSSM
jgi:hypothetical protein